MTYNNFFATATNPLLKWEEPKYPPLNSSEWRTEFDKGTALVKQNLAHSWLWLFNERLKTSADWERKSLIGQVIVENYHWYRDISSVIDTKAIAKKHYYFDGSFDAVFNNLCRGFDEEKALKEPLRALWLGPVEGRSNALSALLDVLGPKFLKVNNFTDSRTSKSSFQSIIPNLVWDISESFVPNSYTKLEAKAIELTVIAASNGFSIPAQGSVRQKAWHGLALRVTTPKFIDAGKYKSLDAFDIISKENPAIAAPGILQMYTIYQVRKPVESLSDARNPLISDLPKGFTVYDMFRKWVPSAAPVWDVAVGLAIDPDEAVKLIKDPNQKSQNRIDTGGLPNNML